jgi:hypothetical protein
LRDPSGRRLGEILVILEKWAGGRQAELRLVARRPPGFPEGDFDRTDGRRTQLVAANAEWYRPIDVPVTSAILSDGLRLTHGSFSLAYDPALAVPFRACLEPISAWLSNRQATVLEEHAVLVQASVLSAAQAFLARNAQSGCRELRGPAGNVPADWSIIERVHLSGVPDTVEPDLKRLAPRLHTATHLEGGLALDSRIYLEGGEPDAWITVELGERCVVAVDGVEQQLAEGANVLALSTLGLPPGKHEITGAGVCRRFTTESGCGGPASHGTGSLGHILRRNGNYRPVAEVATGLPDTSPPPLGTVYVCGAAPAADARDLPLPDRAPELLPAGFDEYAVLGAVAGQVVTPFAPTRPEWLERLDLTAWQFFDVPLTFAAKWLIYGGRVGTKVHRWGDPSALPSRGAGGPPGTLEQLWAQHILSAAACEPDLESSDAALWETYVSFAAEIHRAQGAE